MKPDLRELQENPHLKSQRLLIDWRKCREAKLSNNSKQKESTGKIVWLSASSRTDKSKKEKVPVRDKLILANPLRQTGWQRLQLASRRSNREKD